MIIDYSLLGKAEKFYTNRGYTFIDVPWYVNAEASLITKPPNAGTFILNNGMHLIGSAEQGFIEIIETLIPHKKYASISPCFRKGDNDDRYHQETFMKLELFSYGEPISEDKFAAGLLSDATDAFYYLGIHEDRLYGILTHAHNIDLCVKREHEEMLEIGSYGYRNIIKTTGNYHINYGTGLALPRFQLAELEQHFEEFL